MDSDEILTYKEMLKEDPPARIPLEIIDILAINEDKEIRKLVAKRSNLSTIIIKNLARDQDRGVRLEVLKHHEDIVLESASPEMVQKYEDDKKKDNIEAILGMIVFIGICVGGVIGFFYLSTAIGAAVLDFGNQMLLYGEVTRENSQFMEIWIQGMTTNAWIFIAIGAAIIGAFGCCVALMVFAK